RPQRPAAATAAGDAGEQTRRRPARARRATNARLQVLPFPPREDRLPVALGHDFALVGPQPSKAGIAQHADHRRRRPAPLGASGGRAAPPVPATSDGGARFARLHPTRPVADRLGLRGDHGPRRVIPERSTGPAADTAPRRLFGLAADPFGLLLGLL